MSTITTNPLLKDIPDELLTKIHDILAKYAVTDEAYAHIFALFHDDKSADPISYIQSEKKWQRDGVMLSDVKLFSALGDVCELISSYVHSQWESCIFSAWINQDELTRIENMMATMESLPKLKSILGIASTLLAGKGTGKVSWSADATATPDTSDDDTSDSEPDDEPDSEAVTVQEDDSADDVDD